MTKCCYLPKYPMSAKGVSFTDLRRWTLQTDVQCLKCNTLKSPHCSMIVNTLYRLKFQALGLLIGNGDVSM